MLNSAIAPWVTWFIVSLFYAYQYILRVMPSILMTDISEKFKLNPEGFGQFSGIYYLGYSLAHLPVGFLLDRYGPRKVVPFFILLAVAGILPLCFADLWIYPIFGRALMGIGSSAAILSVFKVIQMTFSENKFSRVLSFSVTFGLLGAMYGGGPIHLIKQNFGYDAVLMGLIVMGVILAFAAFIAIPEVKNQSKDRNFASEVMEILSQKRIIVLCLLAGMMVGPLEGFADVWGTRFLKVVYQLNDSTAASLPSLIFLGMCLGGPLLCYFADWTGRHLQVVLMTALIMAAIFSLLIFAHLGTSALTVLFFVVGICCAYQMLMIYKISTLAGPASSGLATAMSNMVIMTFGYFFHSTIGKLVGAFGGYDNLRGLSISISIIPIALILSAIGLIIWMSRVPQPNESNASLLPLK